MYTERGNGGGRKHGKIRALQVVVVFVRFRIVGIIWSVEFGHVCD